MRALLSVIQRHHKHNELTLHYRLPKILVCAASFLIAFNIQGSCFFKLQSGRSSIGYSQWRIGSVWQETGCPIATVNTASIPFFFSHFQGQYSQTLFYASLKLPSQSCLGSSIIRLGQPQLLDCLGWVIFCAIYSPIICCFKQILRSQFPFQGYTYYLLKNCLEESSVLIILQPKNLQININCLRMFQILIALIINAAATDRPVIGILTLPSDLKDFSSASYSYIPTSYVKWIEAAGAMVIPIQWDDSYDQISSILTRVNGILFTGGDTELYLNNTQPGFKYNKFTDTASFIMSRVIQSNKAGNYFPLFATCQGFQLINYIVSQYYEVLAPVYDDMGVARNLILTNETSTLLQGLSPDVLDHLVNNEGEGVYYSHHWGVLEATHAKIASLNEFFKITALSNDGAGKPYIAIVEGREQPIYGIQFHPEKHQFEWRSKATHDALHIRYAQEMANQFIQMARQNNNTISAEDLSASIIYNYQTTNRMGVNGSSFAEVYLYERTHSQNRIDNRKLGIREFTRH